MDNQKILTSADTLVKYTDPELLEELIELKDYGPKLYPPRQLFVPRTVQEVQCPASTLACDILDNFLGYNVFKDENGQVLKQKVSAEPPSREYLICLNQEFNRRLKINLIRPSGPCPIRRQLHIQLFDELIRQITLGNSIRGLLLLRIRDEILMYLDYISHKYQVAVNFGIRMKTLQENIMEQAKELLEKKRRAVSTLLDREKLMKDREKMLNYTYKEKMKKLKNQWKIKINNLKNSNLALTNLLTSLKVKQIEFTEQLNLDEKE